MQPYSRLLHVRQSCKADAINITVEGGCPATSTQLLPCCQDTHTHKPQISKNTTRMHIQKQHEASYQCQGSKLTSSEVPDTVTHYQVQGLYQHTIAHNDAVRKTLIRLLKTWRTRLHPKHRTDTHRTTQKVIHVSTAKHSRHTSMHKHVHTQQYALQTIPTGSYRHTHNTTQTNTYMLMCCVCKKHNIRSCKKNPAQPGSFEHTTPSPSTRTLSYTQ
jgi:hypothetical protein